MKKSFLTTLIYSAVIVAVTVTALRSDVLTPATAFAVGDITIDWGVPEGDPIFMVTDMAPGETETRPVTVTNDAAGSARPLGVRGVATSPDTISPALDIVISADGTPVYGAGSPTGAKTLQQFFSDSTGPDGIALLTLAPGADTQLEFTVTFAIGAGNEFQNASVTFDIIIGIAIATPAECSAITFTGQPIFGTERGERLVGTAGNDLIFALEGGDLVQGGGGDDCIVGGPGGDSLQGEGGNDVIFGNEGGDSLQGGAGHDRLFGGDAGDSLQGGGGNDYAEGNAGSDGLQGGAGNDTLIGGAGSDGAAGGAGIDTCDAEGESGCEL